MNLSRGGTNHNKTIWKEVSKMSSASLGWERLNDVYYRTRELYTLTWDVEPQPQQIIAIAKTTRTLAAYTPTYHDSSSEITIHTSSGQLIATIAWNHHINGKILGLEWTHDEQLIVFVQNGVVRVYYDFEGDFNEYDLGYEAGLVGIKSFIVSQDVIIVLLNDFKIVYVDLGKEVVIPKLFKDLTADIDSSLQFLSWDVVATNDHNKFQILISLNNAVYEITKYGKAQKVLMDGPFRDILISSNNQFVASYNQLSSKVSILTTSLNKILLEFIIPSNPIQVKWCGSDAVVASYPDSLKLIAPGGSIDFFFTNEITKIQTELDGLTVLTDTTIEFMSKIDQATVDCFKIGSTTNASILLDAIDKLNKHSPKANENLKIIGSTTNLKEAVDTCMIASLEEFEPYWQKKLLKAASFGKSDVELRTSDSSIAKKFVETCNILRILNDIRLADVGLYLTYHEYKTLGIENVIKLLIKRQKFYESFQISKFLQLPIDLVFIDWACCKIKYNANLNDEELSQSIISKFQSINNNSYISFEKISNIAFQEGRLNLAKILINFESLFSKQIPLLLKMEEHELALQKAIDSQDIDLILETLFILQETLSLPNFFKHLNSAKNASNVFEYFHQGDIKLIHEFYNQADKLIDISNNEINQVLNEPVSEGSLDRQMRVFNEAKDSYALQLRNSNDHKQIEQHLKLLKYQLEFTNSFNIDFTNLSIIQTLEKLILLGQTSKIQQFRRDFKINDRKYYFVKLNYLIDNVRYDELHEWISSKKPPIGYEPFLKKLIAKKELRLASKILKRASLSYDDNIQYLIRLKDYQTAIEQASNKKDIATLQRLDSLVTVPSLKELIAENISKISATSTYFSGRL